MGEFVAKDLKKTANKLKTKYGKKRIVNEKKLLAYKSRSQKAFSVFCNLFLVFIIFYSLTIALSTFLNRVNKTAPSLCGYTYMQVATGSMSNDSIDINGKPYASKHMVGDKIIIRSVNTSTLNIGDKIAFYVDNTTYKSFYSGQPHLIKELHKTEYKTNFIEFLGFKSNTISSTAKKGGKLVFHHIVEIYECADGTRWFKTQGSANTTKDNWVIKEDYVVGIYDTSKTGQIILTILNFLTSNIGLITVVIIPIALVVILILKDGIKDVILAKLELDVVEEKRKLTDEICIKNNIGFRMSRRTKLKVLAQAEDDEKMEYLHLLYKNGTTPNALRKYYLRKRLQLIPIRELLKANRECEKMFKDGVKPEKIANHYLTEKEKIQQKAELLNKRLKAVRKNASN